MIKYFFIFLIIAGACSSGKIQRFKKVHYPTSKNLGALYLLRPSETTKALWDSEILIKKYKTNYRSEDYAFQKSFVLSNGEFVRVELPPGQYKVELPGHNNRFLIVRIKPRKATFIAILLHSKNFFSMAEFVLQRQTLDEALQALLAGSRMYQEIPEK